MTTFVIVHGGGDSAFSWHLVESELRKLGHDVVVPDMPAGDDSQSLTDYADFVAEAAGDRSDIVVVGQSFGGFIAPIVANKMNADSLVLLSGMIPRPGETFNDWWDATGFSDAVARQAAIDGGLTGNEDPMIGFLHDVPPDLAQEALSHGRDFPSTASTTEPWPLDKWPAVPTRFILCQDDRFFPPDFFRRLAPERLGITPEEIPGSHCVMLSRPAEVATALAERSGSSQV